MPLADDRNEFVTVSCKVRQLPFANDVVHQSLESKNARQEDIFGTCETAIIQLPDDVMMH